ncbi:MAG: DUF4870 domain-containing protein [bacterium]
MSQTEEQQARNWAMLCHLAGLAGYIVPLGNILGPLAIWLIKKDELPLVDEQGKEALNFQISITIYVFAAAILSIVLIGLPLLFGLLIAQIVLVIVAAVKVNNGESYSYPFTIRLIN